MRRPKTQYEDDRPSFRDVMLQRIQPPETRVIWLEAMKPINEFARLKEWYWQAKQTGQMRECIRGMLECIGKLDELGVLQNGRPMPTPEEWRMFDPDTYEPAPE